ncbi:MAG: ribose 5-phosphate isomerase A [Blastochloris sp.]|nr:ribose 5-phosphate isomerase A [Blastochloris sp.]
MKQLAAEHATRRVVSGMKLGLGTGSTVRYVLDALAQRLRKGELADIVGVPTSEATTQQAQELGIALATLAEQPRLDLTLDGADEIDADLHVIKGLGGAMLREKMVALAARELVIVADESKLSTQLGSKSRLPVEVVQFGWSIHMPFLQRLGAQPRLRTTANGSPYITDNGNYILDCTFPDGIDTPAELAEALDRHVGIVGHGLFLGMATEAYIGTTEGISVLRKPAGKGERHT